MRDKFMVFAADNPRYWNVVFAVFVLAYFLPVGIGAINTIFYLLILLPALLSVRRADVSLLFHYRPFWLLMALCAYAILRSTDVETTRHLLKSTIVVFGLVVAGSRLPVVPPEKVKRLSAILLVVLIVYVLSNAAYQRSTIGWNFGQRLSLLFGPSDSVIFTADLMISALAIYAWSCFKTQNIRFLALVQVAVLAVAIFFLQSRSIIPAWFVSSLVLLATQVEGRRKVAVGVAFMAVAVAVIWLALYWSEMLHTMTVRGDSYRIETWSAYVKRAWDCGFVTGCGWGRELGFVARDGSPVVHPHSMYVQHFYWGGAVGLLLLVACIVAPLIDGLRASNVVACPLLVGSVAFAFDGHDLVSTPNGRLLLMLVPLAVLIGQLARSPRPESRGA